MYKDNQAAIIGLIEMSSGIGLTTGPVIGSLLYDWGGFKAPFIFYGAVFLIAGLLIKKILPASID